MYVLTEVCTNQVTNVLHSNSYVLYLLMYFFVSLIYVLQGEIQSRSSTVHGPYCSLIITCSTVFVTQISKS